MSERGRFIVFEGQGYTGKTTVMERVAQRYQSLGLPVVTTFHPGGIPETESIREEILTRKKNGTLPLQEEVDMFCHALAVLQDYVESQVRLGVNVLCTRWWSTVKVYQGMEQGVDLDLIRQREQSTTRDFTPDLIALVHVEPEEVYRRMCGGQRDLHAYNPMDMAKLSKRARGYLQLVEEDPTGLWQTLDGHGTPDQVENQAWQLIVDRFAVV